MTAEKIIVENSGYIVLKRIIDARDGELFVIEGDETVPFAIKRSYYIKGFTRGVSERGAHAHKELVQAIFCINGSCKLSLDDGKNKQELDMQEDNIGIILGPGLWHDMSEFEDNCILLVLASDHYKEEDYIRNYADFIEFTRRE